MMPNFKDFILAKWSLGMAWIQARNQWQILGMGLLLLAAMAWAQRLPSSKENPASSEFDSFDTVIPKGFVLIPIDVQNSESLDRILGNFGQVNLYASSSNGDFQNSQKPGQLIARNIKILRAPLDPREYAVLAPEEDVGHILSFPQPFVIAVQNPKSVGIGFEKSLPQTSPITSTSEREKFLKTEAKKYGKIKSRRIVRE